MFTIYILPQPRSALKQTNACWYSPRLCNMARFPPPTLAKATLSRACVSERDFPDSWLATNDWIAGAILLRR